MRFGHRYRDDARLVPFAELGGTRVDLSMLPSVASVELIDELIPQWTEIADAVGRELRDVIAAGGGVPIDPEAVLAPPIARPAKAFGVGFNYLDHAREFGTKVPEKPNVFMIATSSLVGHRQPIDLDGELSSEVDWEAELAVVIGRSMRNVSVDTALDGVFGYTICNDVTARDLQRSESQWSRAKGFDGSHPLGPVVVTADEIPDPQALSIALDLNGGSMQKGSTGDMVFSVAEILAFISEAITLEPGDIIATGTPPGVGAFRTPPVFLADDDVISIEIEHIGCLENRCRAVVRGAMP